MAQVAPIAGVAVPDKRSPYSRQREGGQGVATDLLAPMLPMTLARTPGRVPEVRLGFPKDERVRCAHAQPTNAIPRAPTAHSYAAPYRMVATSRDAQRGGT